MQIMKTSKVGRDEKRKVVEVLSPMTLGCFLSFLNAKPPLFRLMELTHSILAPGDDE